MEAIIDSSAATVWSSCLELLKPEMKKSTFTTWFEPIVPKKLEDSLLTIEVPSSFFYEYLEEHYFSTIQSTIQEVLGAQAKLQYAVKVQMNDPFHIANPGYPVNGSGSEASTADASAHEEHTEATDSGSDVQKTINTRYTFENFIRGDGNQFARAAALNVANNPGETAFNPLVLYGGVGLGKTHLLQAIGNQALSANKNIRVCYVSSEKFTIDFVEAIEKNKTIEFSNYYRSMDVLIVDDIQFFSGKERTQDTFFHTFNTLHQLKKQIILSSDKPPKDLRGLDDRLISRFQWGLTVDVQPPDLETRIAILRKKSEADHIHLPQDVIEYIASNVKSNIRELEGCYIGLVARHTLENNPITIELAQSIVRNIVSMERKELSVEQIQKIVADHFHVSENSLRAKTRKQEIVFPRQIAMYLAKNFTRASLKTIGLHFGGRDHSTIIHACKTINEALDNDESMRVHVEELEKQLTYVIS
jgi:chromosomal replication initiator protein